MLVTNIIASSMTDNRNKQLERLGDLFSLMHKAILSKYGGSVAPITPVLSKVLMIVGSEQEVNIKRIAELLQVTSGAATQHVAALEEVGVVKRVPGKSDRRESKVILTSQGEIMYREIKLKSLEILGDVFQSLSDEELETMITVMTKVSSTYQLEGAQR